MDISKLLNSVDKTGSESSSHDCTSSSDPHPYVRTQLPQNNESNHNGGYYDDEDDGEELEGLEFGHESDNNDEDEDFEDEPVDEDDAIMRNGRRLPREEEPSSPSTKKRKRRSKGNGRGPKWKPWELRALVKATLNADPYTCIGQREKSCRWKEIVEELKSQGIKRTKRGVQERVAFLLTKHKAKMAKSLMETGTNEEVTEFTHDMDELAALADTSSRDAELRKKAKERFQQMEKDGSVIRQEALEGLANSDSDDAHSATSDAERHKKRHKKSHKQRIEEIEARFAEEDECLMDELQEQQKIEQRRHEEMLTSQREMLQAQKETQKSITFLANSMKAMLQILDRRLK